MADPWAEFRTNSNDAWAEFRVVKPQQTQRPEQSIGNQLLTDFSNQLSAAEQRTTPIQSEGGHAPNFLSDQIWEDDAGRAGFKDAQGNSVLADSSKHVILRDPADGVLKAYARTDNTNESGLDSLARVVTMGALATPTLPATMGAARAVQAVNPAIEAAQRLDVPLSRAAASTSPAIQKTAQALEGVAFAGVPMRESSIETIQALEAAKDKLRLQAGGLTPESAGNKFITGIDQYNNNLLYDPGSKADQLYGKVEGLINQDYRAPMQQGSQAVDDIQARFSNTNMEGQAPPVKAFGDAIQSERGANYAGVKDLRSMVGRAAQSKTQDFAKGELDQIYGGLSNDLNSVVEATGGPEAVAAQNRANRFYKAGKGREEALAKIIGNDRSPEQVINSIYRMGLEGGSADIGRLAKAKKAIGNEGWNEISSAFMGRLFDSPQFVSQYNKMSDAGKTLLFGEAKKHIDDIFTVSEKMQKFGREANHSNTANVGALLTAGATAGGEILAYGIPFKTLGGIFGARGLAKVLSKPVTAKAASRWARALELNARQPSKGTLANLNHASTNLARTSQSVGFNISPDDLFRASQGMNPAAADEQNQP